MAIDIHKEELFNLREAHFRLPRKPSRYKVARWAEYGIKDRTGKKIRLETVKIGGEVCTSAEAFQRFCDAVNTEL